MKLISYNIHVGMDEFRRFTLFQLIKYLKEQDADIICLQEVLYYQFNLMKLLLKMDGIFGLHVNNKKVKFGICILSKRKIIESNHFLLTSKKEQRGLLSINSTDLLIINTHLGLDSDERKLQISEILDFTKGKCDNIIICGDFNEKNIYMNNFNDVAVDLNKDNLPTFAKNRIDYCFISENLTAKSYIVDEVYMSDHFPVIVEFSD